jgi:hypothetical protein
VHAPTEHNLENGGAVIMTLAAVGAVSHNNGRNSGEGPMVTPEKPAFDPNASAVARKPVPFLVFRENKVEQKVAVLAPKTTIGGAASCDVVLADPSLPPYWGVIIRRGESVFVQHEGGFPIAIEQGEGAVVGPYALVRADLGTELGRVWKSAEPGTLVQPSDPSRPLYRQVFALAATDMGARGPKGSSPSEGAPAVPERLSTYPTEKRMSERARDAFEQMSRAVSRAAADRALVVDADPSLRVLESLAYPELVAVLEELGASKMEGEAGLSVFIERFLVAEPIMAFRFRALVRQKIAAEARGAGEKMQLPALPVNFNLYVASDLLKRLDDVTREVERLVDEAAR